MSFSYLKKIKHYYYFRIRIPLDLKDTIGLTEVQISLRTRDSKLAKGHARLLLAKAEKTFCMIRSDIIPPDQILPYFQAQFPNRRSRTAKAKPLMLFEAIDLFLKEHVSLGKWTEKTATEVTFSLRMFKNTIGNRPLRQIDRQTMVGYVEKLSKLPANMQKRSSTGARPFRRFWRWTFLIR